MQDIDRFSAELGGKSAGEILVWAGEVFGAEGIALASSLGAEDQILTHLVRSRVPEVGIFTIDTGRLPGETYDLMQKTMEAYGFRYEILFPDLGELETLVHEHGPNLFYKSLELRKACCYARKVVPLQRKLAGLKAWICGLRRSQGVTRGNAATVQWDEANGLVKINPLADWPEEDVWTYIKRNKVPYNVLHDKGYPSIGCAPCTRAVKPGEDMRSGRWWWESSEHKECGLHLRGAR